MEIRKEQANRIVNLENKILSLEYPLGGPAAYTLAHARREWSYNKLESNDQINKELDKIEEILRIYEKVMKEDY